MTQQKPPKSTAEPTIGNRVASPELLNREENATSDENHLATRLAGVLDFGAGIYEIFHVCLVCRPMLSQQSVQRSDRA
jgi:hypothetical protein